MKTKLLLRIAACCILLLTFGIFVFSQDVIFKTQFKNFKILDQEPVFVSNDQNDTTLMILKGNNNLLYCSILDKNLAKIKEYQINQALIEKAELTTGYYSNGRYNIIFRNKENIIKLIIEPAQFSFSYKFYNLESNELYLSAFPVDKKVYLLTIEKRSSILSLYDISDSSAYIKRKYDFNKYRFKDDTFYRLSEVLFTGSFSPESKIVKMPNEFSNDFISSSSYCKLYYDNDYLKITTDFFYDRTIIITLNLHDFSSNVKEYYYKTPKKVSFLSGIASNSFLFKNMLFQGSASSDSLFYSVVDIVSDKVIEDKKISKQQSIDFKTSSIQKLDYTKGIINFLPDETEINKTSRFLKSLSNSQFSILVNTIRDTIQVKIGGVITNTSGGGTMMVSGGQSFSTPGGTITAAPTFQSFGGSTNNSVIYFNTTYNKSFSHIEDSIHYSSTDVAMKYLFNERRNISNIFQYYRNGNVYVCFLNTKEKTYYIKKF